MRKTLVRTGMALVALVIVITAVFMVWALTPSMARQAALDALKSDAAVSVTKDGGSLVFSPAVREASTGLIFYPGGHIDYRAYAPVLNRIAAQGILVVLVPVRLNLAFLDIDAGASALKRHPQISVWATGGHSLGGVASALFAAKHPEIKAVVFWASYPPDSSLRDSDIKVLSICGTLDGGLDHGATIEKHKADEPADSTFVVIEGGNHGQFADYGPQPGDNPATISPQAQWDQTSAATVAFLRSLGG
ncbi:MAG TPA: alpha/beta hydrolase [bacterium]|nr:alpha/beta hydrolase [bacterium]